MSTSTTRTAEPAQTPESLSRDLRVSGVITLLMAPGLAVFGLVLGLFVSAEIAPVMIAIALLLAHIAAGLLAASLAVTRWPSIASALRPDS